MFTKRIIPCLDVNNGRVVKGVNFVNLKDAGDPVEIAKAYDREGADELVFLDITASSDNRKTAVEMVRKVAASVFIPFTVGGGIRTVEDFPQPSPGRSGQNCSQLCGDHESGSDSGSGGQVRQSVCGGCHRRKKTGRRRMEHLQKWRPG